MDLVFSTKKAFRDELLKFCSKPPVPNSAKEENPGEKIEILHLLWMERPIIHSSIHQFILPFIHRLQLNRGQVFPSISRHVLAIWDISKFLLQVLRGL